jgi:hypothetical protein
MGFRCFQKIDDGSGSDDDDDDDDGNDSSSVLHLFTC